MTLKATSYAALVLTFVACGAHRPQASRPWPTALALTPMERRTAACYRVRGVTAGDSASTGFAADSILRLDTAILRVVVPSQGPDIREYVNEHPFWPRPDNFDTVWWRGHDGTLHLEWRTPRQSGKVYIYGGGEAAVRESGDSLVGQTTVFRDVGPSPTLPVALKRLPQCPLALDSISGAT
ncbi:MAG TPA: hypothetical protein VII30_07730 [Gemmatimonadaceae bacterium]